ncbi:MAG: zinc ribbon domain-containing protein, partial [Vicinamibacteria bacterium]
MIAATPDEQRRLLALQGIDTAIAQLEFRRANLPEQKALDENAETLSKVSTEYAAAKDRLERLGAQQRKHESEIAAIDARRKSEEGRMYSGLIRSEKELEALRQEIGQLRGRKSDLEESLLEIMEQVEDLESLVESLKARHVELTAAVEELTQARDTTATDIDAELAERRAEREAAAAELPDEVLEYYDDLRARKQGVAVAELQGRTCAGCRLELTQIELEDAHRDAADSLARCEQCGRI